ncbi:MAG: DNA translocase FtsK 4TM domain-containing protein [Bacteroidota bacterium]
MGKTKAKHSSDNKKLRNEQYKFFLGLFFIFLAIYILLAFSSFFFTWKVDQSFEWGEVVSTANLTVENWGGKVGARLANLFIAKWFGIGSFSLPLILIVIGTKLLRIKILPVKKSIKYSIIGTILISLITGFVWDDMNGYLVNGLGGGHGVIMTHWLNAFIGKAGTAFVIILTVTAYILSIINKPIFEIKSKMINFFQNLPNTILRLVKPTTDGAAESKPEPQLVNTENPYSKPEEAEAEKQPGKKEDESTDNLSVSNTEKEQSEAAVTENTTANNTIKQDQESEEEIQLTIEEKKQETEDNFDQERHIEDYDPTLELSHFEMPPLEILEEYESDEGEKQINKEEIIRNKNKIVETLGNYKIQIDKIKATVGPTITLYEIVPAPGIRISKIKNLEDDIALSLAALGIRIIAPIPGKGTIGIEVPNENKETVSMRSVLASKAFRESGYELPLGLGKTISNESFVVELSKMPHLLVAGATGQGKSVGLNAIISSLLYKKHPSQLKFVMVDPKKVELTLYTKIQNHYLAKLPDIEDPIVTENKDIIKTLNSLCVEMDNRYNLLKSAHVRNLKEYNRKFVKKRLNPNKGHRFLPYIVVIIDEFADLIMTAGKEVEGPIARLAQLARAIGIHLIIATQRPTTNIITGVIKANFPARIAFRVTSMVDSRTILDSPGANQLVGRGDMLISTGSDLTRVQCAFVDTEELEKLTDFISNQQGFGEPYILPEYQEESGTENGSNKTIDKWDPLFEEAARMIVRNQQGSTSLIQRKLAIGYNRAGRIMDQLEAANIVGPHEGSKARDVLFPDEYTLEQFLTNFNKE